MIPQISIIVPIYNVEIYLHRCIDSLLSQTMQDYEILLINDGSCDQSGHICNEYEKKDHRIRVFHKDNGGVSSARQYGTNKARGKYIIHVDPDDWVEPNMLQDMYNEIILKNADIVISDFYIDHNDEIIYKNQYTKTSSEEVLRNILNGTIMGVLWNKLIKQELYKNRNVHFINGINYCEDALILAQILTNDNLNISYLNRGFYHYNVTNNNSITKNFTTSSYIHRKNYILSLEKILPPKYNKNIDSAALDVKFEAFTHNLLPKNDYYKFRTHSIKDVLSSKLSVKGKFFFILASIGLFEISVILYQLLKNIKSYLHC